MKGGDIAYNVRTGEFRLVIAYDPFRQEVTFSRDPKWYSSKDWVTSLALNSGKNIG